jgi:FkbM family methyltransferase
MKDKSYYEKYFISNKQSFLGEEGHENLLKYLIPIINKNILTNNSNNFLNIFIDVGSCVGSYTNNLLKMADKFDNFIIYSFEPNELNFKTLTNNKNEKIIYKKLALSNKKSNGFLYNFEGHKNFEGNQICHINNKNNTNKTILQEIEIDTLENILNSEIKTDFQIKFLKIDTEGNDTNVIKGMGSLINKVEYIIFECSDCLDDSRGPDIINPFEDIIKYLDNNNFTTFYIGKNGLLPIYGSFFSHVYENNKQWSNVLAINNNIINQELLNNLNIL